MSAMSWSSSRMSSTICAQHANVLSLTVPTPWLAVQNRGLLQVLNSTLASRWLLAGQILLAGVQVEQEALRAQASMDERCSNLRWPQLTLRTRPMRWLTALTSVLKSRRRSSADRETVSAMRSSCG